MILNHSCSIALGAYDEPFGDSSSPFAGRLFSQVGAFGLRTPQGRHGRRWAAKGAFRAIASTESFRGASEGARKIPKGTGA